MRNWRTTLAGLLVGLPFAIQSILEAYTAGYFTDKTGMQLFAAIGLIIITRLTKDHNVSGVVATEEEIGGGGIQNPPKP